MKKNLLAASLITMGCLYGVLAAFIVLLFYFWELPISTALLISIVIVVLQLLLSPLLTDLTYKIFYKANFDAEIPEYLSDFINSICEKYKMKYPRIGIVEDGAPNAFTYGITKNSARIVLTRGIFNLLNEEEVKTVVAHELGHATHYDILVMTGAQLVPLIFYYVYSVFVDNDSDRNDKDNNQKMLIGYIAYLLYIISQYIILYLSRTREYYADSFSIEETKNPSALAEALVKIGFGLAKGSEEKKSKLSTGNALGISDSKLSKGLAISSYNGGEISKESILNAMKWEQWNVWAKLNELNSTHPLISNRLKAISARCSEFNQEPYIDFNLEKPESYVDDFILEILLVSSPTIILIAALILAGVSGSTVVLGIGGLLLALSLLLNLNRTHKNKGYKETNVAELLGEVKVSEVTSIPCILEGKIIGKGDPGCIFNEDFVLQDQTGIIFLDYKQPLYVLNKLFAVFRSGKYINQNVKIKGWYRRGLTPYVEIYSMECDGKVKKCHTYTALKLFIAALAIASIATIFYGIFG